MQLLSLSLKISLNLERQAWNMYNLCKMISNILHLENNIIFIMHMIKQIKQKLQLGKIILYKKNMFNKLKLSKLLTISTWN